MIATVHIAAWRGAYRGAMPDSYLDGLSLETVSARWRRRLEDGGGDGRFADGDASATLLLGEDATGRVVGISGAGSARGLDEPTTGELWLINLDPVAWGTGVGADLLASATGLLGAEGCHAAVLWVLETNGRARRFYEKWGWRPDGVTRVDQSFGFPLAEVRYRRPLGL
ncbi:MAG TPA: GNAT family N-acetyltransferase [Acidimicrobiales bacterium]|nr:GNAT family N-acetyltransferase [Acidimicrobiales bacterium]